ncbi:tetraacyldisaccharide 4'-kinase [Aequorivita sp. H23M31]|uniref:Tetraacyldisaccharide 4'-kinase n=1 Tax=Aequorivita ciconiae TaxID=2494375 RepID=A0A451FSB5_9FLAO|nr:tetraacyldisaccharide 4'-kinase [Aequorivita sp. H23M31]QAA80284.1 tetraacyldisaccharide 4'-kinase [Aequorivita sp. H23M31]
MKLLRKLLFPFSLIYWVITAVRNKFYDFGWLKSKAYDFPVICVGNLSTGGTGKSPMIEFLISRLKCEWRLAVLSRGYKRETKGFKMVEVDSTVLETGDEPLQFKRKFPKITVAVCEDRQEGVEILRKNSDLILLDDAFQHRKVRASYYILLTSYGNLFVDDFILPVGNLREPKSGADRADVLVVTKCPGKLEPSEMERIRKKLRLQTHQEVYFTKIGYAREITDGVNTKSLEYLNKIKFTLVTGIANPKPLVEFLKNKGLEFYHKSYGDHHNFTIGEITDLERERIILTTEKDFMRLQPVIKNAELYYLPITTEFLGNTSEEFLKRIFSNL